MQKVPFLVRNGWTRSSIECEIRQYNAGYYVQRAGVPTGNAKIDGVRRYSYDTCFPKGCRPLGPEGMRALQRLHDDSRDDSPDVRLGILRAWLETNVVETVAEGRELRSWGEEHNYG